MNQISLAIKNFNDRVKQMNQTNSKQLTLSAEEARNLHSDVFALLANITEIVSNSKIQPEITASNKIELDGGGF